MNVRRLRLLPVGVAIATLAGCAPAALAPGAIAPAAFPPADPARGAEPAPVADPAPVAPDAPAGPTQDAPRGAGFEPPAFAIAPEAARPLLPPTPSQPTHARDELVVSLQAGVRPATVLARPELAGATLMRDLDFDGQHVLTLRLSDPARLGAAHAALSTLAAVRHVAFNTFARAHGATTDTRYGEQWAHLPDFANTEGAWSKLGSVDQSKVIVAIIDSGCDVTHEEFKVSAVGDRLMGARNVTPKPAAVEGTEEQWAGNLTDDLGHGTLTAGIIGATGNNSKGVAGVAWGVKLMPIKADSFDDAGSTTFRLADVVAGIKYAATYEDAGGARVRVINMSLGENSARVNPLYYDAIQYARRKGVLVVVSTGNAGSPVVGSPANAPGALAVGSTSRYLGFEFVSHFSNYGPRLDLVAPGGGILAPIPTTPNQLGGRGTPPLTTYAFASGTSEAAPYVSGVAALVFAKYDPSNASLAAPQDAMTMVDKVRAHLLRSVDDFGTPGWDPSWGYGRINAEKAVSSPTLLEKDPTDPHQAPS